MKRFIADRIDDLAEVLAHVADGCYAKAKFRAGTFFDRLGGAIESLSVRLSNLAYDIDPGPYEDNIEDFPFDDEPEDSVPRNDPRYLPEFPAYPIDPTATEAFYADGLAHHSEVHDHDLHRLADDGNPHHHD